jgi:hypothetical protein
VKGLYCGVEPLLCHDREMGGYTRDVSGQQLGKHVPAATDANATIEGLCGPCRDVITKGQDRQSSVQFWTGVCERGGRGVATVGAATGEDTAGWRRLSV